MGPDTAPLEYTVFLKQDHYDRIVVFIDREIDSTREHLDELYDYNDLAIEVYGEDDYWRDLIQTEQDLVAISLLASQLGIPETHWVKRLSV